MSNVQVLNISKLRKPASMVVVIDDVRHERAEPTVEDLLTTVEDVEALAVPNVKMSEQLKITLRIITRAFPTLTEAMLRKRPAEELNALFDAARGEVEVEAEDEAGNEKPAS